MNKLLALLHRGAVEHRNAVHFPELIHREQPCLLREQVGQDKTAKFGAAFGFHEREHLKQGGIPFYLSFGHQLGRYKRSQRCGGGTEVKPVGKGNAVFGAKLPVAHPFHQKNTVVAQHGIYQAGYAAMETYRVRYSTGILGRHIQA